ncbi:MAG: hypothetical protein KY475_11390, partial [Planctomycetes bacterium]|nr:hypothetical protein [Planctomycetota bacterium]
MPPTDERAALVAALRQHICRLKALGFSRPSAVSLPQYLRGLGEEGVLPEGRDIAELYEACRFGKSPVAGDERAMAAFDEALKSLEELDPEQRETLVRRCDQRWMPPRPAPRPALPRAPEPRLGGRQPVRGPSPPRDVQTRKRIVERGPSRFWTIVACGLVLWTMVVMAGSLWQRDRI